MNFQYTVKGLGPSLGFRVSGKEMEHVWLSVPGTPGGLGEGSDAFATGLALPIGP